MNRGDGLDLVVRGTMARHAPPPPDDLLLRVMSEVDVMSQRRMIRHWFAPMPGTGWIVATAAVAVVSLAVGLSLPWFRPAPGTDTPASSTPTPDAAALLGTYTGTELCHVEGGANRSTEQGVWICDLHLAGGERLSGSLTYVWPVEYGVTSPDGQAWNVGAFWHGRATLDAASGTWTGTAVADHPQPVAPVAPGFRPVIAGGEREPTTVTLLSSGSLLSGRVLIIQVSACDPPLTNAQSGQEPPICDVTATLE